MTIFVLAAAAMLAVALAWVLVPLLRRSSAAVAVDRTASNLNILRDQMAELDADLRNGVLSDEQYREAKAELERRVIDESRAAGPAPVAAPQRSRGVAAILGVTLSVAAVSLYLILGNRQAFSPERAAAAGNEVTREQIESMVARLAERMEKAPKDVQGWTMLARSYTMLGRHSEAAAAYERLSRLLPGDAGVLVNYAVALAMGQGENLEGKPLALIKRALAIDPENAQALALSGSAAFARRDYRGAVGYWERAQKSVPADSRIAMSLASSITEARQLAGAKAPAKAARAAPAAGSSLSGRVTLSPALSAKVAPGDTLFVFARAEGQRMPVAILRRQAGELPLAFTLDESTVMVPGTSFAAFPQLSVVARISKSGSATPQVGDMEGSSAPVRPGARDVAIVIDTLRP